MRLHFQRPIIQDRSEGAFGFEHFRNASIYFFLPTLPSSNFHNYEDVLDLRGLVGEGLGHWQAAGRSCLRSPEVALLGVAARPLARLAGNQIWPLERPEFCWQRFEILFFLLAKVLHEVQFFFSKRHFKPKLLLNLFLNRSIKYHLHFENTLLPKIHLYYPKVLPKSVAAGLLRKIHLYYRRHIDELLGLSKHSQDAIFVHSKAPRKGEGTSSQV